MNEFFFFSKFYCCVIWKSWIAMLFIFLSSKGASFLPLQLSFMLLESFTIPLVALSALAQTLESSLALVNCTWPCQNSKDGCIVTLDSVRCQLPQPNQYVQLFNRKWFSFKYWSSSILKYNFSLFFFFHITLQNLDWTFRS